MSTGGRARFGLLVVAVAAIVLAAGCVPPRQDNPIDPVVGSLVPGSQLIGCDQAAQRITVTVSSHLDPSCTYTRGIDITASNVVLDCRGARLQLGAGLPSTNGIFITTPADVPLSNVTVRNCIVKGFSNNLRVHREGFKDLVQGAEYANGTSGILIENSHFYDSTATGLYIDGYVTGVTLDNDEISGSGAVGVYLEAGSKDNVIEDSRIHHNGFAGTGPDGVPITVGGTELRYETTGREGIAIDGSRDNVVRGNWIAGNSAGAIFLYKNCGENATTNPDAHWVRHYGATGNVISGNVISAEKNGVWVGSRAAENQFPLDCSDPTYVSSPARQVFLDPASGNTIRANNFLFDTYPVRVEDDSTTIDANTFSKNTAEPAVLIGTKERTNVLARPVTGTVITGNRSSGPTATPYQWIWGHTSTTASDNQSNGVAAPLVQGVQPTINPFLFAIRVWIP